MSLILNIETSSRVCSVCLSKDGEVVTIRESEESQNHASLINIFIEKIFSEANITFKDLCAVAVSAGPGSYTGLRIGVSTAKGICYPLNIPLIAIDTLQVMSTGYTDKFLPEKNALLCPVIDARRMEVYYSLFNSSGEVLLKNKNTILDENFLHEYSGKPIHFFGSGAEKLKSVIAGSYSFIDFPASSSYMTQHSYLAFNKKEFAELAYFEPTYIKPFYDTGEKK